MPTSTNHGYLWMALLLYSSGLLYAFWRLALGKPYRRWPKLALILPGFFLHGFFMWERGLSQGRCPVSNLFETLTFVAWCLVALNLVVTTFGRVNYMTVFYMPIVLVIQLAALIAPTDHPHFDQWKESAWLGMHASIIMLGYAAFALAGAVALMYLVQEHQLRTRRLSISFMLLPPMLRLESVQSRLLVTGFSLLTLGLGTGFMGMHLLHKETAHMDPKLFWSIGVWGCYLAMVVGHYRFGLSGRWLARLSVAGCIFVFSTFWLANFFSQFHRY